MQHNGEMFAARDVVTELAEASASIEMEIAGAYPGEAGERSYRRRVVLDKGRGVTIVDRYEGERAATLSLMFAQQPVIEGERIVLEGLATIDAAGAGAISVEAIEITDARLKWAWPDRLYRALVPLAGNELTLTIE